MVHKKDMAKHKGKKTPMHKKHKGIEIEVEIEHKGKKKPEHKKKPENKIKKVMEEYSHGELHSGSKKGPIVKNKAQALAIGYSEMKRSKKKHKKHKEPKSIHHSTDY